MSIHLTVGLLGSSFILPLHVQLSLIWWVFSANLCICRRRSTMMLFFLYLHISSILLDMVYFINDIIIFELRPTLSPNMHVIKVTRHPLLVITLLLVGVLQHGGVRSSTIFSLQDQIQIPRHDAYILQDALGTYST